MLFGGVSVSIHNCQKQGIITKNYDYAFDVAYVDKSFDKNIFYDGNYGRRWIFEHNSGAIIPWKATSYGTKGAVIFGMVYDFLPYMVLPIYTTISKLDTNLLEAAQDLGCNQFGVLSKVILPLSASGIVSGVTMVFVPSISTFYISQKLGGGTFELIGDTIERQFQNSSTYNVGAAISLVMMILVLVSLAIMNKFAEEEV